MRQEIRMRSFSQKELMHLLYVCSELLNYAYEDTNFEDFKEASNEASMAFQYLNSQFELQNQSYKLH